MSRLFDEAFADMSTRLPKPGVLDSVMYALTGNPDSDLTPQQLSERNKRRADAGNMAANYENPGEEFMQPVSGGGNGSALESLGKIAQLLGGLG